MAILKCKMCGGDLVIEEGATVCECEYCGSKQTVPTQDNEKKLTLFARANRLRMAGEFDKASGIYESIVADFPEEAEAYWGIVLCKYGIEYVDDPATGKKVPTCHRSSFDSVMKDSDFEQACENADGIARRVYREEAKQIEELRKGIIEVSGKEQPYDIFISYKETDNGDRTIDSVIAQDIYDALTDKGYRVFFSRISLEDKLGTEYEPYIFAALNSAKLMLVVGTDYEYFNAVWVKNEWSRFIKLMAKDKTKHLIPVYKSIDAYDMPEEFAKLAAQDMGKVGAMQDLLRGIDKLIGAKKEETVNTSSAPAQPVIQQVVSGGPNTEALIKRGYDALEDKQFEEAKNYFNDALNSNAESAEAYLGLFMAEIWAESQCSAKVKFVEGDYADNRYWKRARQYASGAFSEALKQWEDERNARLKREAEAERKRKEAEAEAIRKWKAKAEAEAERKRKEAEAERKRKEAEAKEKEKQIAAIREQLSEIEKEIASKRSYLAELGIFKVKEKNRVQEQISELTEKSGQLGKKIIEIEKELIEIEKELIEIKIAGFGRYKQEEGKESQPIEWKVLDIKDGKALIISKYALDCVEYNTEFTAVTWATCTLRTWLNSDFYNAAFSSEEQAMIASTIVTADKKPEYDTDPGNNTTDKVFLLSITEAEKYFSSNTERQCTPTAYAIANGAGTSDYWQTASGEAACWWLRSPGYRSDSAACVHYDGSIYYDGNIVSYDKDCVRPALWINLDQALENT